MSLLSIFYLVPHESAHWNGQKKWKKASQIKKTELLIKCSHSHTLQLRCLRAWVTLLFVECAVSLYYVGTAWRTCLFIQRSGEPGERQTALCDISATCHNYFVWAPHSWEREGRLQTCINMHAVWWQPKSNMLLINPIAPLRSFISLAMN